MKTSSVRVLYCVLALGQGSLTHPSPHYQHICHCSMKVFILRPRYTGPFECLHRRAWYFPVWLYFPSLQENNLFSEWDLKKSINTFILGYSQVLRFILAGHITTLIQNVYSLKFNAHLKTIFVIIVKVLEIMGGATQSSPIFFLKLCHVVIQIFY